jgi:predicted dienelactone hydrolase
VIIFSHGNQNNAIDYAYTLESLASAGFIVAAPDHVNNTQDDIRIDYINQQAQRLAGDPKLTLIRCFDRLPSPDHVSSPCEISDRVKAENPLGIDPPLPIPCPQVSSITSTLPTVSARESLTDRVRDISAIIDALPTWFGDRADTSRVGVMGHSRGTVTALAAAGGSTCWGFPAEPRVKAIMGLAIGALNITFAANVRDVRVPALLVAGTLDHTAPEAITKAAFNMLGSTDKTFVEIKNAEHRHFDSGLCAQTKSAGVIAEKDSRAILDSQTIITLVTSRTSGIAMDFCGPDTFFDTTTNPPTYDIRPLVASVTTFQFPETVPTTGLDSDTVKNEVVTRAVAFFERVL